MATLQSTKTEKPEVVKISGFFWVDKSPPPTRVMEQSLTFAY
jgi:hypothetical protein